MTHNLLFSPLQKTHVRSVTWAVAEALATEWHWRVLIPLGMMLNDSPRPLSEGLLFTEKKMRKCCHYNQDQRALWQPDTRSAHWSALLLCQYFISDIFMQPEIWSSNGPAAGGGCSQTWGTNRPSSQHSSWTPIRCVSVILHYYCWPYTALCVCVWR